jgi:hypothetical protein
LAAFFILGVIYCLFLAHLFKFGRVICFHFFSKFCTSLNQGSIFEGV